jgi:hypothetical protein
MQYFPYCAINIKPFLIHSIYCTTFQYDPQSVNVIVQYEISHNNIDRLRAALHQKLPENLELMQDLSDTNATLTEYTEFEELWRQVMVSVLHQRVPNFFQVGTTFISQNVLRTTLLLSP